MTDQMIVKFRVDALDQVFQLLDFNLNTGLGKGVVILDHVQDDVQAPKGIGLDGLSQFQG